jgi:Holliday junction resolvase-like predicted endonuclease
MMTNRKASARAVLGGAGERLAAGWPEARGYRVLARNWRCIYGEIDVIAIQLDGRGRLTDVRHYRSAIALGEE